MLLENLKIILSIIGTQTNAKDLVTPQADLVEKIEQSFSDGTGADQAQVIFSDTRTLAGSTNESLDLAGGLPHALGGTITFSAIKAIIVKARDTNTGNLRVGAGVANAFQGFFGASAIGNLVTPDGLLVLIDPSATGQAVTGGTGDLLRIENLSAGSSDYDIYIIGEGTVA
jgi:hypothetical protein